MKNGCSFDLIRRPTDAVAKLSVSDSDAGFLTKALKRLPAADEYNLPVTVDLNGAAAIRAQSDEGQQPTEVFLSSSTASGEAIRFNTNRRYLDRALIWSTAIPATIASLQWMPILLPPTKKLRIRMSAMRRCAKGTVACRSARRLSKVGCSISLSSSGIFCRRTTPAARSYLWMTGRASGVLTVERALAKRSAGRA